MSKPDKEHMRKQIEQLTCFLDAAYAGLVTNLKITWDYDWDDRDRNRSRNDPWAAKTKRDHRKDYGKHTEIVLDTPTYWGTMSGELYEQAYHWREKLIDKVDDDRRAKAAAFMDAEYGPESRRS